MPEKSTLPMPKISGRERTFAVYAVAAILAPLVRLIMRPVSEGIERLPKSGPYILVGNHVTHVDALAVAYFIFVQTKRAPHFLAKEGLFRVPVLGKILLAAGQIPVYRSGGLRNDEPMRVAHAYLEAGHSICIFPEGTLTRDPNLWPMRGRSGAVRLALETGVPIYSIAHWGSEKILPRYTSKFRPGFWKPVRILVGGEIDLSSYRKRQLSPQELHAATEVVMQAITKLVEQLRGEKSPGTFWDPSQHGQAVTGNFVKAKKSRKKSGKVES